MTDLDFAYDLTLDEARRRSAVNLGLHLIRQLLAAVRAAKDLELVPIPHLKGLAVEGLPLSSSHLAQ